LQSKQQNVKIVIPENKDIFLDLNGNIVSTYGTIEVLGNLEIIDTTNEGKIESHTVGALIKNEGDGTVEVSRRDS